MREVAISRMTTPETLADSTNIANRSLRLNAL